MPPGPKYPPIMMDRYTSTARDLHSDQRRKLLGYRVRHGLLVGERDPDPAAAAQNQRDGPRGRRAFLLHLHRGHVAEPDLGERLALLARDRQRERPGAPVDLDVEEGAVEEVEHPAERRSRREEEGHDGDEESVPGAHAE